MPAEPPAPGIEPTPSPRRLPFAGIVALWTLFGLWSAQQTLLLAITSGREVESWIRPFASAMLGAWYWAAITPALMWLTRRLRDRVAWLPRRIGVHLVAFLVVHVLDIAIYANVHAMVGVRTRPFSEMIFSVASFNVLNYVIVVAATVALDYHDAFRERGLRAAHLEAQLALARFESLRAQLHPHFLFNSLNAVSALMHTDVQRADRMLARLSELLRIATDTATAPEVTLRQEVEFVQRYLEIEQMRFGNRLGVRIDVPAETYDAMVPNMLLHPLVENAVRHGVAPYARAGQVEISAERHGDRLDIVVGDTGPGVDPEALAHADRPGVGLRSTRERLASLYGSAHEFALVNVPGGFESRVSLPFRRNGSLL